MVEERGLEGRGEGRVLASASLIGNRAKLEVSSRSTTVFVTSSTFVSRLAVKLANLPSSAQHMHEAVGTNQIKSSQINPTIH